MKIVADDAIPWLDEAFGDLGQLVAMPGRNIDAEAVRDAQVLLTRSITRVDAELVHGSRVALVVSATAGTDHVDRDALQDAGIAFEHAPGCNAQGVVEYVLTELLAAATHGEPGWLARGPIGVVGFGHVGRRLTATLRDLGLEVIVNDPPLQRARQDNALPALPGEHIQLVEAESFVSLSELVDQAAVVSLHVPAVDGGDCPTRALFDADRLARMRPDALLINTSRGEVVPNAALRDWLDETSASAVLDVWEGEPVLDADLGAHAKVLRATPHIAGYTVQGKARGTAMAHAAVCRQLGRVPTFGVADVVPAATPAPTPTVRTSDVHWLAALMRGHHDLSGVDTATRALVTLDSTSRAQAFEDLRRGYPLRSELSQRVQPTPPEVEQRVLNVRLDSVLRRLCPQSA